MVQSSRAVQTVIFGSIVKPQPEPLAGLPSGQQPLFKDQEKAGKRAAALTLVPVDDDATGAAGLGCLVRHRWLAVQPLL